MSVKFNILLRACDKVESVHKVKRPYNLNKLQTIKVSFYSLYKSLQSSQYQIKIIGDEAEINAISQIFYEMASALNEKGSLALSDVKTLVTFNSSVISSDTNKSKHVDHYGKQGSIAARNYGQEQ